LSEKPAILAGFFYFIINNKSFLNIILFQNPMAQTLKKPKRHCASWTAI